MLRLRQTIKLCHPKQVPNYFTIFLTTFTRQTRLWNDYWHNDVFCFVEIEVQTATFEITCALENIQAQLAQGSISQNHMFLFNYKIVSVEHNILLTFSCLLIKFTRRMQICGINLHKWKQLLPAKSRMRMLHRRQILCR